MDIQQYAFRSFYRIIGRIDTIEREEERAKEAIENIKTLELEEKINVFIGEALEILPTLNNKYDMVFIDAAKRKVPIFFEWGFENVEKGDNNFCW